MKNLLVLLFLPSLAFAQPSPSSGPFPVGRVSAANINPNVQVYTNTGIYCSVIMTNNQYVLTGAAGSHTNSANTSLSFATANGTYTWCTTCKGNAIGTTTNTGLFQQVADPTWVISYQYYSPALYPAWVIYNTNTWIYSGSVGTNSVLRLGQDNVLLQSTHGSQYLPDMTLTNFGNYIPDQAASAMNLVPVYTTNVQTLTATVYDPVKGLLNFPHVGPVQTSVRRANVQPPFGVFSANLAGNGILHVTNGALVVRGIEIMASQFATGNLRSNYWVQIFPDYGTNDTTFANVKSNFMTFNVPLTALASCKWDNTNAPFGIGGMSYSTEYLDVTEGAYGGTVTASQLPVIKVSLDLPFPCTNGCYARVIDALNNVELTSQFYSTVNYEVDATGALNYPFRDWRLHGVNTRFSCVEVNGQGATDWSKTQVTMFTATNCAGVVLGIWVGLDGLNGPNATSGNYQFPMETANWEWICDGQYPPMMLAGEDAFFAPYEAYLPAPILQRRHGMTTRIGDPSPTFPASFDAYRQFTSDYQPAWQNSVTALLTTGSPGGGFLGDITTLYYSAP